jgi:hypothetical protein
VVAQAAATITAMVGPFLLGLFVLREAAHALSPPRRSSALHESA